MYSVHPKFHEWCTIGFTSKWGIRMMRPMIIFLHWWEVEGIRGGKQCLKANYLMAFTLLILIFILLDSNEANKSLQQHNVPDLDPLKGYKERE